MSLTFALTTSSCLTVTKNQAKPKEKFLPKHKRVRGKKLSETRLGLLAKWQESSPFLGRNPNQFYSLKVSLQLGLFLWELYLEEREVFSLLYMDFLLITRLPHLLRLRSWIYPTSVCHPAKMLQLRLKTQAVVLPC